MTSLSRRRGRPLPKDFRDRRRNVEAWPRVEASPKCQPHDEPGELGWTVRTSVSAAALLTAYELHPPVTYTGFLPTIDPFPEKQ